MAEKFERHRQAWTTEEVQKLHLLATKGMSLKACDLQTYPLCADSPGRHGCHWIIGSTGMFTREQRRELERKYIEQTREKMGAE